MARRTAVLAPVLDITGRIAARAAAETGTLKITGAGGADVVPLDSPLIGHKVSIRIAIRTGEKIRHGWLAETSDDNLYVTTGSRPGDGPSFTVRRRAVLSIAHLKLDCTCHRPIPGPPTGR